MRGAADQKRNAICPRSDSSFNYRNGWLQQQAKDGYRAVSTDLYFREKNFRIFVMRKFRLEVLAHPEGWECKIFLVAKVLRE